MNSHKIIEKIRNRNTKNDKSETLQKSLLNADWKKFESHTWEKIEELLKNYNDPVGVIDIRFSEEDYELHLSIDSTNSLRESFNNGSFSEEEDLSIDVNWFIEKLNHSYEFKMGIVLTGYIIELLKLNLANHSITGLNLLTPFYIQRGFYSGADPDPYYDSSGKIPCNNSSCF